jgi:peptidoglycan lytic transglycosylase G
VLGVLAVLLLPFLLVGGWFVWQLYEPGGDGTQVTVMVQRGWGAKQIGDELASKDVVGSSLAFQVWYRVSGGSTQAGTYTLREHMGVKDAVDALGRQPDHAAAGAEHTVLALPPGLRLEQIADRVGALPGHDRAAFLALAQSGRIRSKYQGDQTSVEGFTWPDTYFVEGMTDEQILQTIVSEFDQHGDAVGLGVPTSTALTPQQAVVLASLVQAEAGTTDDAPKVAAVVTNRLRQGTPLQIDATLCYAKGGCPPVPTNADKQFDSPYNTYRVSGLPPTPIMTVTEQALRAALAPANVPYLFYVTGKDGVTYFANTLAEHEANIRAHGVRGE